MKSIAAKVLRRIKRLLPTRDYKRSYAQCGEDLIVSSAFSILGISNPSYLDLGAHHPTYLSNTYYFYRQRRYGVCVEPDPVCFKSFQKKRKRDVCLNVGAGIEANAEADFFLMSAATLNTFSQEEAERIDKETSYKIIQQIKVPLVPINQIIEQHFRSAPNFVSLDIEGLDLELLHSFDFDRWRPEVFCIETVVFSESRSGSVKTTDIIQFMKKQGYFVFADTYINTIFVDQVRWDKQA